LPSSKGSPAAGGTGTHRDPIPPHVRRLLGHRLASVSEVETLVLLVRTAGRRWSAEDVARQFVLDPEHTALLLDALVRAGLVRRTDDGHYEFDPAGESDRAAAADLAALYATYRNRIMGIVLASKG
jgi:predicted transcriptional regulator of viral defense system